jgi:hypothetical protein
MAFTLGAQELTTMTWSTKRDIANIGTLRAFTTTPSIDARIMGHKPLAKSLTPLKGRSKKSTHPTAKDRVKQGKRKITRTLGKEDELENCAERAWWREEAEEKPYGGLVNHSEFRRPRGAHISP